MAQILLRHEAGEVISKDALEGIGAPPGMGRSS
jgi:hypothetical protein